MYLVTFFFSWYLYSVLYSKPHPWILPRLPRICFSPFFPAFTVSNIPVHTGLVHLSCCFSLVQYFSLLCFNQGSVSAFSSQSHLSPWSMWLRKWTLSLVLWPAEKEDFEQNQGTKEVAWGRQSRHSRWTKREKGCLVDDYLKQNSLREVRWSRKPSLVDWLRSKLLWICFNLIGFYADTPKLMHFFFIQSYFYQFHALPKFRCRMLSERP